MRPDESGVSQPFPVTQWTMVGRAGDPDPAGSRAALAQLLHLYMPALRSHLVTVKRIPATQADDLLQSFVTAKFLESNLAAAADRKRGKFRTLLLTSLDRFLISEHRRAAAIQRGGGKLFDVDPAEMQIEDTAQVSPSSAFEIAWARELLSVVLRRMRSECEQSGRPETWAVFDCRLLQPVLGRAPAREYGELVREFGFQSPTQAANILVTAKRMFQRLLKAAVAEYATSEEEIEEEIRDLCAILARGGASMGD